MVENLVKVNVEMIDEDRIQPKSQKTFSETSEWKCILVVQWRKDIFATDDYRQSYSRQLSKWVERVSIH